MKSTIKELAGQALLRTGLWERSLRKWVHRGEAIILTYHRVIEKWDRTLDYSQPGMVVTAETFDHQLHFLKKYFHIVSLSDVVNPKSALNPRLSTISRPLCSITFDDGWRDNCEIAFPILRKHQVPATIFLTTDFIGTNRTFWHTRLMYVLLHGDMSNGIRIRKTVESYPAAVRHYLARFFPMTEAPCAQDVNPFVEAVKRTCDEDTIENLIRDLAYASGVRRPLLADRRFFLEWDHVCEMAAAGIEVGSHGCSHRILTRLEADQAEDELTRSKAEIEQRIGGKVRHFAFPDGAFNRSLMESASRAGYESVSLLAATPGQWDARILTLRRVGMHEGASVGSKGSFSETSVLQWLLRAPRTRSGR